LLSEGPDTLPRMNWPWRKRPQPAPAVQVPQVAGPTYDAAALGIFLEHARAMAAWHEARASAFERKAGTLLGFIGVILVLLPTLRSPIAKAHGGHVRMVLVELAILAIGLLTLGAVSTAMVLLPRAYEEPSLPQLRERWTTYYEHADLTQAGVTGMFVDQLVRGTKSRSPIETLYDDAEKRAKWMKRATWLVLCGVVALAVLTGTLLVEGGV
jgi:hypothetical protein